MSNTAVATIDQNKKSVLVDMANRFHMEPAAFQKTVMATCMPDGKATNEQFAAFLLVAKEYKLNPLTKEIYAFPSRGGIVPVVSIDGWVNLINSHSQSDGFDFIYEHDDQGKLISCTCSMYRKDRTHPVVVTEYFEECVRNTEPWKKWPNRMLRHKTLIQAARYAFGFAGIYDDDEAERIAGASQQVDGPAPERPKREDYQDDTPITDVEPEPIDDEPLFFIDAYGEKDEEPLDQSEFIEKINNAMDECQLEQAVDQLLEHNQEAIASLSEPARKAVDEAEQQTRARLKEIAAEEEKKAAKAAKEAEKQKAAETAPAQEKEQEPEPAGGDEPPPPESDAPPPSEEQPAAADDDLVIPLKYSEVNPSVPREKLFHKEITEAFTAEQSPDRIRAIWKANEANIKKCSKSWQDKIVKAGKNRIAELEKEAG